MKEEEFSKFARESCESAETSFKNKDYLEAAEYYFYAGEAFENCGEKLLSADCYKMSFVSNIKSSELLKDSLAEGYLDNMETILLEENRFDLLESSFQKIETSLNNNGYYSLGSKYYSKKMSYKKKLFFKEGKIVRWMIYNIWGLTSKYGESFILWLITLSIIALVYSIIYLPAPYKFMESIYITHNNIQLDTFIDYFYFSLITLADWDCISPLNICGRLIIVSKFFLGIIMCGLLVSMLSKKFTRR